MIKIELRKGALSRSAAQKKCCIGAFTTSYAAFSGGVFLADSLLGGQLLY